MVCSDGFLEAKAFCHFFFLLNVFLDSVTKPLSASQMSDRLWAVDTDMVRRAPPTARKANSVQEEPDQNNTHPHTHSHIH